MQRLPLIYRQCSAEKFHNGDNVPGLLKKWGHCGKNDGPVIWRSKISSPSVYIITDHTLTVINNLLTN